MKILHISDTHGFHENLVLPDLSTIDVIIHSGDESNYRNPIPNKKEFYDFIEWYGSLEHPHKIMIAGNHSSYIATHKKDAEAAMEREGIIYLNKTFVEIDGKVIYGDPITPTFGDWYFMASRDKIHKHWELLPEHCDILVTHGPPKGILDLSYNRKNELEFCGCSSLRRHIEKHQHIKAVLFGHIHDNREFKNIGVLHRDGIVYSNAAAVVDGRFDLGIVNHGNIIEI